MYAYMSIYRLIRYTGSLIRYTGSASYTGNASTGNQLYRQRNHRQPVIHAGKAQATSYTRNLPKHKQLVVPTAQAQATSFTAPDPLLDAEFHADFECEHRFLETVRKIEFKINLSRGVMKSICVAA